MSSVFEKNYSRRVEFYSQFVSPERAKEIAQIPNKNRRHRQLLIETQGAFCKQCGAKENLTVDHIEPVRTQRPGVRQGNLKNKQILCSECNWKKSDGNKRDFNSLEAKERFIKGHKIINLPPEQNPKNSQRIMNKTMNKLKDTVALVVLIAVLGLCLTALIVSFIHDFSNALKGLLTVAVIALVFWSAIRVGMISERK